MKRDWRKIIALLLAFSLVGQMVLDQVGTYMNADVVSSAIEALTEQPEPEKDDASEEPVQAEPLGKAQPETETPAAEEESENASAEDAKPAEAEAQNPETEAAGEPADADTQGEQTQDQAEDAVEQPAQDQDPAQPAYVNQLIYENDDLKVTLDAAETDQIPQDAYLSVTRIVKQEITEEMTQELDQQTLAAIEDTNALYDEYCRSLAAKATAELYTIQGFMFYDFSILQADGTPLPTQDDLTLTLEYKAPAYIKDVDTTDMDVRIFKPLAREDDAQDKDVIPALDLARKEDKDDHNHTTNIDLTDRHEINKAALLCDSLYPVALAWTLDLPDDVLTAALEDVTVTVTAKPGIIPQGASLSVTPILKGTPDYAEVEEKLNEKAEGEAYDIAGFLAYDIKLLDENAAEVEPKGEVKVSMEYTQAAAPEGLDEDTMKDADVTVMHLEENAKGEVVEVVDLVADEATEATVETTSENKVEKVDAVTTSFSKYIITWNSTTIENGKYIVYTESGGKYYALDKDGKAVELTVGSPSTTNGTINLNSADSTTLENKNVIWSVDNNKFSIGNSRIQLESNKAVGNNSNSLSYNSYNKKFYRNRGYNQATYLQYGSNSFSVTDNGNQASAIYLAKVVVDTRPDTIQGVDSRTDGITINLFDYYGSNSADLDVSSNTLSANGQTTNVKNNGINKNHDLKFLFCGTSPDSNTKFTINHFTGTNRNAALQGIVKKTLCDTNGTSSKPNGYPALSTDGNQSLNYLFDTSLTTSGRTVYEDVTGLFQKDADGRYNYNSDNYYAYYEVDTNKNSNKEFTLYNGTFDEDKHKPPFRVGFFPFNDYNDSKTTVTTGEAESGYNHHFGLSMSAYFAMPEDGRVNGKDMIFDFSGDDDMWVFIDGVLVLDIGGVHEPVHGSINFTTGAVTIDHVIQLGDKDEDKNVKAFNSNIKSIYTNALQGTGDSIDSNDWSGNTFANNTYHKIDVFYIERGGQYSNLDISFNLNIIPATYPVRKIWQDGLVNHSGYKVMAELQQQVGTSTTWTKWNPTVGQSNPVELNETNNWSHTFTNLARFDLTTAKVGRALKPISYQVVENSCTRTENPTDIKDKNGYSYTQINGIGGGSMLNTKETTPKIKLKKTFKGLTWNQIKATSFYDNYQISVSRKADTTNNIEALTKTVKLKDAIEIAYKANSTATTDTVINLKATPSTVPTFDPDTPWEYTFYWEMDDFSKASYEVEETNYAYTNYSVSPSVQGVAGAKNTNVSLTARTLNASQLQQVSQYTDQLAWNSGANQMFVVPRQNNTGYIIYTKEKLIGMQREAIIDAINNDSKFADFTTTATDKNCYFYEGNAITATVDTTKKDTDAIMYSQDTQIKVVNGKLVFVDKNSTDTAPVATKDKWDKSILGTYSFGSTTLPNDADIFLKNEYKPAVDLDLKKVSASDATLELENAEFELYYKEKATDTTWSIVTAADNKYEALLDSNSQKRDAFKVSNSTADDSKDLKDLEPGYYKLKEIKAPAGYSLLTEEIYFKVVYDSNLKKYKVEMCNADGTTPASASTAYDFDGTTIVLTIKNAPLYSLPSTGGTGIYWSTLIGILLMIAAGMLTLRRRA